MVPSLILVIKSKTAFACGTHRGTHLCILPRSRWEGVFDTDITFLNLGTRGQERYHSLSGMTGNITSVFCDSKRLVKASKPTANLAYEAQESAKITAGD